MLACLGMFRFGPTWEEALCMFEKFEQNGLEAMLACFLRFRPGTILIRRGRHAHGCRHSVFVKTSLTVGFWLMVFLCCQALAQDAGAHGQRASQVLKFW